jgi:hypothetical protein
MFENLQRQLLHYLTSKNVGCLSRRIHRENEAFIKRSYLNLRCLLSVKCLNLNRMAHNSYTTERTISMHSKIVRFRKLCVAGNLTILNITFVNSLNNFKNTYDLCPNKSAFRKVNRSCIFSTYLLRHAISAPHAK